jgi:hypothetical protein
MMSNRYNPWGLNRARCELRSRRVERSLSVGRQVPRVSNRFFSAGLQRFATNWS